MTKKVHLTPDHKAIGGARIHSNDGPDAHKHLWAGTIMHVDTESMLCSVRLDSGEGERHDVPLPAPAGGGPRSWAGVVPEVGTKVILGWKKYSHRAYKPYIIQFMTTGTLTARNYEPFSSADPSEVADALSDFPDMGEIPGVNLGVTRLKLRKAYSGDYLASSSSGADILLDRNVMLTNRAGNEFLLRDSDQTAILQVLNEYTSSGAGYYKRGLIKRSGLNILPDVFGIESNKAAADKAAAAVEAADGIDYFGPGISHVVDPTSVAFQILRDQGLITTNSDGNGVPNFPTDPDDGSWHGWPFVVTSDGQRISYITRGDHSDSFSQTDECYVEDRMELRHVSDGIMAVTEEGDGVQVDKVHPVFIERVYGTVVGNDPHSDAGRTLYKQILKMRVFDDPEQQSPSSGPKFDAVDMVQHHTQADTQALAHLFRVQSPTTGNQFCFGITKEGRVMCHVPKSADGESMDVGKSIDLNVEGLIKMIVGADPNTQNASLDMKLQGGILLDVGRLADGRSVHLKLGGKVKTEYGGNDANGLACETVVGGSAMMVVSSTNTKIVNGADYELLGGAKVMECTGYSVNAGAGGLKSKVGGDYGMSVIGKTTEQYAQVVMRTNILGCLKTTLAGVDSSTILAGGSLRTVVAGTGIADTVVTGNYAATVATGNFAATVGAGNFAATVGAGSLSLTAGGGPISITSGAVVAMTAVSATFTVPVTVFGASPVGGMVAGIPGPPSPHLDYLTGIPILGIATHLVG